MTPAASMTRATRAAEGRHRAGAGGGMTAAAAAAEVGMGEVGTTNTMTNGWRAGAVAAEEGATAAAGSYEW